MFRINKEKCIGCRACIARCPGATKIGPDGKAEIIDQEKLEECGGENLCPMGAIERVLEKEEKRERLPISSSQSPPSYKAFSGLFFSRPFGERGRGWGWLKGIGRRWRGRKRF